MKNDALRTIYSAGVNFDFLDAMGIKIVVYQPWQLGLFHDELEGKFVWYPKAGTLMYDNKADRDVFYKVGQSGDFVAGGHYGDFDPMVTERVYEEIIKKAYPEE